MRNEKKKVGRDSNPDKLFLSKNGEEQKKHKIEFVIGREKV